MTIFDSTKMTCSLAPNLSTKRQRTSAHTFSIHAVRDAEDALIEHIGDSVLGNASEKGESAKCMFQSDELLLQTLKRAASSATILGVSKRKLKSLRFRLRRRSLKMSQLGTPFNKREIAKNSNRQSAALARKRDVSGKFLNVPIYPKTKTPA